MSIKVNVNRVVMAWISIICMVAGLVLAGMAVNGFALTSVIEMDPQELRIAKSMSGYMSAAMVSSLPDDFGMFCWENASELLLIGAIVYLLGLLLPQGMTEDELEEAGRGYLMLKLKAFGKVFACKVNSVVLGSLMAALIGVTALSMGVYGLIVMMDDGAMVWEVQRALSMSRMLGANPALGIVEQLALFCWDNYAALLIVGTAALVGGAVLLKVQADRRKAVRAAA